MKLESYEDKFAEKNEKTKKKKAKKKHQIRLDHLNYRVLSPLDKKQNLASAAPFFSEQNTQTPVNACLNNSLPKLTVILIPHVNHI